MNLQEAISIIGSDLGEPSKIPAFSFGLSAKDCITGSKLRQVEGSTCSKCYSFNRGNYTFPHVVQAMDRRLLGINHEQWVEAMVYLINRRSTSHKLKKNNKGQLAIRVSPKYFRWHDSGDLQSMQHLANIAEVCRQTPQVTHWLPSREYDIIRDWFASGGIRPINLIIRLSAHLINGPLPIKLAEQLQIQTSGVHTKNWILNKDIQACPSHLQNNQCMECRSCWDPNIMSISYLKH